MTRTDFEIVNSYGVTIATAETEDLARAWVRRNIMRFPGLRVEKVSVTTTREVVYRPRLVTKVAA